MAVREQKESSSGKEGSGSPDLASVLGTLPFESRILACLFFTSFQFYNPSVSLKLFDAFSILALADCSAYICINKIQFTYKVSFPIPLRRVSVADRRNGIISVGLCISSASLVRGVIFFSFFFFLIYFVL